MSSQETSDSDDEIYFGKYTINEAKRDILKYVSKNVDYRHSALGKVTYPQCSQEMSDSDDEICFGKYTIKEAKRDVLKYIPKKINRRHSLCPKLSGCQINGTEENTASSHSSQGSVNVQPENQVQYSLHDESDAKKSREVPEKLGLPCIEDNNTIMQLSKEANTTLISKNKFNFEKDNTTGIINCEKESKRSMTAEIQCTNSKTSKNVSTKTSRNSKLKDTNNYKKSTRTSIPDITSTSSLKIQSNINRASINPQEYESQADVQPENKVLCSLRYESDAKISSEVPDKSELTCIQDSNTSNIALISEIHFNTENSNTGITMNCELEPKDTIAAEIQCTTLNSEISRISKPEDINNYQKSRPTSEVLDSTASASLKVQPLIKKASNNPQEYEPQVDVQPENQIHCSLGYESDAKIYSEDPDKPELTCNTGMKHTIETNTEIYVEDFDDSLEDINSFLAQKEPSQITDPLSPNTALNTSLHMVELKPPMQNVLSPKSLHECKKFYSAEKITKPSLEVKNSKTAEKSRYQQMSKIKPPSVNARDLFSNHKKAIEVQSAFKVPSKPTKKLLTPNKLPNTKLKSVVSPVGVYIRHSPKFCPLKKVPPNTSNSTAKLSKLAEPIFTSVKENIPCAFNQEFPAVIYKPAKTKEVRERKEIILPENIKKLINIQVVTKHERQIRDNKCNQSIERRLMESDLSIDSSYDNQDISILTNKQPFNIKKF